jgi:hypothetical protein
LIRFALATVGVLLVTLAGCSSPAARQTYDVETSHLRSLLSLRTQALSQGQLPKSEVDFKRYINSLDAAMLDRIKTVSGVSTIDELFVSERDGKPYVIFYGERPAGVARDLVGYEQIGVDGKRYVGFGLGVVEEVDEQRFAELVPPAARPAQ